MKKLSITITLLFWMLFTLLLAISLVGIIVLIREDHDCKRFQGEEGEAMWFRFGRNLANELIK